MIQKWHERLAIVICIILILPWGTATLIVPGVLLDNGFGDLWSAIFLLTGFVFCFGIFLISTLIYYIFGVLEKMEESRIFNYCSKNDRFCTAFCE